ncbi:hypothetical protein [Thioalkalivibrio sp. HL-Eb18]|jgi:hypothetical protein|uniref:hypothetical protein n=1 Tax=Thioalkalivibrio sp. HL-Eb18 TaxID=1266913 RepID=UPI000377BDAB|nr:hypothetical protein [Thioalkalivibrio sp. HL-Eb18]
MAKSQEPSAPIQYRSTGRPPRYLIVLLVLAVIWAAFWGVVMLQSGEPKPVTLSDQEQVELEAKLQAISAPDAPRPDQAPSEPIIDLEADAEPLIPELYEETDEARIVQFSERELNALIARDPDLAGRVAVRLTPGQVSTRVRIDVPADVPLLGGRVLNVRSGVRFETEGEELRARLVGVSVAGIPLPDAWLGGLKDEDLLALEPFQHLRAGIESIDVREGELALHLAR